MIIIRPWTHIFFWNINSYLYTYKWSKVRL